MDLRIHRLSRGVLRRNILGASYVALGSLGSVAPTVAQQVSQAGVDVRQLERRYEQQGLDQSTDARRQVAVPRVPRSEIGGDPKPLFVLRKVSVAGARAIEAGALASAWQSYIGKKVSQADLAAIAVSVGDVYRAAGYHLSRASVPPQDIAGGAIQIKVIEGSITDKA